MDLGMGALSDSGALCSESFSLAQAVHTGQQHCPCKAYEGIILIIKNIKRSPNGRKSLLKCCLGRVGVP